MKWIYKALQPCTDIPQYECSECGKRFLDCKSWNYCPNCGSKNGKSKVESNIRVTLPVLLEVMRSKACPRPNFGDDNWVRVIEVMEETIHFAEQWYENSLYDDEAFMKAKASREAQGKDMMEI